MELNQKVFDVFPVLHTRRLTLRAINTGDAKDIFRMRSSGRINEFIAREDMQDMEAALLLAERTAAAYRNRQGIGWAGILKQNASFIGTCGFNTIDYANLRAEIGGELDVAYWGRNIALEALTAILEFGFSEWNLHSVEAKVSPENKGALYLLACLGFRKEAHFRERIFFKDRFYDMAVYTLLRN